MPDQVDLRTLPLPDDSAIQDAWVTRYCIACATAAVEVGLMAALAERPQLDRCLAELGLDARIGERVVRVLTAQNITTPVAVDGTVGLTEFGRAYWLPSSPLYRGAEFEGRIQRPDVEQPRFDDEAHAKVVAGLRRAWVPLGHDGQAYADSWAAGELDAAAARYFSRLMHAHSFTPALAAARSGAFAGLELIGDVGGGSGSFCVAIAAHEPRARLMHMDLASVCSAAEPYVEGHGLGDRVEYHPLDFFCDPWPTGFDALVFGNILHDWPHDACLGLLGRARAALRPGGRVFVHEVLLDEPDYAPSRPAVMHLLMGLSYRGQQFRFDELAALLTDAGFEAVTRRHRFGYYTLVEARARAA